MPDFSRSKQPLIRSSFSERSISFRTLRLGVLGNSSTHFYVTRDLKIS
ncbi:MAG: hypothetical protein CM1200mP15_07490 [Dehalococcoidia bacterium]|nr:MAG: hypothetical protein CM1200mP15_07490 [Dehalococcoidia bacterium]